jgi:hypothetical protein
VARAEVKSLTTTAARTALQQPERRGAIRSSLEEEDDSTWSSYSAREYPSVELELAKANNLENSEE